MAAYVKVTYSVSSTTSPTCVARYEWLNQQVEDWIDHVTIGSSGGTVITIEPWAPEGTSIWYYTYTFPTTGAQDLYFFSKTNEIPDYAFIDIQATYSPGYILSIDCSQSNNDITGIGVSTFALNDSMRSAYLSDNITRIGRNAFEQDSAMTVCNIPESLSAIPASMFQFCRSLQHVRIPDSVQSIRAAAFAYCTSLKDVYLGSGLTFFNSFAFGGCSALISITATSKNSLTYYSNTFKDVHTGGTLYYPAGYESEYGPESGMLGTQQYLLGYYGWNGQEEAVPATDITLVLPPSITGSGQTTVVVTPSYASTDLRYASSNDSIATVTQEGLVVAVRDGEVTISVKDMNTGLESQQTITVKTSSEPVNPDDMVYVYTGFTVADSEQKRFNIVAEKGAKYKCLGVTYKTISACDARYSLYYVNSYGGVDVLVFKGKSFKKTDNITRLNYSRSFRNNTLEFENVNYMNEIKPAWELHTGYMVDSQSRKMHELVESTCVYLYDAEEQTYTPVVMTDKNLEYKTFYNQGRRFYTYTINVEESQSRERR